MTPRSQTTGRSTSRRRSRGELCRLQTPSYHRGGCRRAAARSNRSPPTCAVRIKSPPSSPSCGPPFTAVVIGSRRLSPQQQENNRAWPSAPFTARLSCPAALSTSEYVVRRQCDLYDLHNELVPYVEAWSWQNAIVKEKKALSQNNEDLADSLIILQHHPVYTLGAGSSEEYLNFDVKDAPFDLYRTERGGEVTYHGPGQLVMYPIINLRRYKMDLHWYLRALEEVVIRALSSAFAIEASRIEGLTGVWVGNKKLAAIGIKVSQWISYHGLALNVTTDITPFQRIVPCGIQDRQVGTIKGLLKENSQYKVGGEDNRVTTNDFELIDITHKALITEFCEVFQVDIGVNLYKDEAVKFLHFTMLSH